MAARLRLIRSGHWLALPIALLVLAALYLAADVEGLGLVHSGNYPYVFVTAAVALLLLATAIVLRLRALRDGLRQGAAGARLSRRLLVWLLVLALPPLGLVYGFSVRFVSVTVDSWLPASSEALLQRALQLGRARLDERRQQATTVVDRLAERLAQLPPAGWPALLEQALVEHTALQLAVFDRRGRLQALAAQDARWIDARLAADELAAALESRRSPALFDPLVSAPHLRQWQRLPGRGDVHVLLALLPLPTDYGGELLALERGIAEVRQAAFLRDSLKLVFVLILTFVLLLSLLLAILLAFDLSRRLVAPIARLAAATREVSEGHYHQRLPEGQDDELGFLVRSFNHMLRELELSTARARHSQDESDRQRRFLQAVLGSLGSAVLVIDPDGRLRAANPAAGALLGSDPEALVGHSLHELRRLRPPLQPLLDQLGQQLRGEAREFRAELALGEPAQRQLWLLRGARLDDGALVAVGDDTTLIDRARRDAAWAEVARRLAHEVKNPLTPIQLAAERLRRRILPQLPAAEAEVLDRATHTIVAQVDALKTLVNAFGDYAHTPPLQLQAVELPRLLQEVAELYAGVPRLQLSLRIADPLPPARLDAGRLRQVLHNLIKNAQEASGEAPCQLELELTAVDDSGRRWLELVVADRGPGLPDGFDAQWFEPYRTTKPKGTGLGLAIVRRIVEEHGGQLQAANRPDGGARFSIRLPL